MVEKEVHQTSIGCPWLAIAAHPDDETIGLGAQLAEKRHWQFLFVTDGSPRDLSDARREGFETREAYARARWGEFLRFLKCARIDPSCSQSLLCPDQESTFHLVEISHALANSIVKLR